MENEVNPEPLIPTNQLPESYYEVKVEGGKLAPFVPPVATEPAPIEDEKHIETLTERSKLMEAHARDLEEKLAAAAAAAETLSIRSKGLEDHARQLEKDFQDYKALTDARFDKMVALLASK